MNGWFVDTSVWSLALRRGSTLESAEGGRLARALEGAEPVVTTVLVLQELLQDFRGPPRDRIVERFGALTFLVPDRDDQVRAADLRNACRRGVQIGTDRRVVRGRMHRDLILLTIDTEFRRVARLHPMRVWQP